MMKLCFATRNAHKIKEVSSLLGDDFSISSLDDIGCSMDLPETSGTIKGNSLQKAQYVWDHYQIDCFADDSGLEVDALDGAPGVDSAFYSGSRDFQANIDLLLKNLADKENRAAQFITVFTLIRGGAVQQFTGIVRGKILEEGRGKEGFGYDPVFLPDGYDRTFAQMALEEKNTISHRSQGLRQLLDYLKTL